MLYIGAAGIKGGPGDQRLLSARLSVCEGEASSKTTTQTLNTTNPTGLCVNQPALSWGLKSDSREESSEPGWEEKTETNKGIPTSHCLRQMSMFLRCAFEKWSHAFCRVAAVKTAVICSTLG